MKKAFRILLWSLVALLFVGTFVYLFLNSRPKEVRYETVSPTVTDIRKTSILTGKIEPRDEIEIKPQVSGIISEIMIEAGDFVKEGDIVARIKIVPDESQLSSAKARIATAKISLDDAVTKHERNTLLLDKKVISREEFDNSATSLAQAKAELAAAEDAYSIVKEGVSRSNATESNTLVRATITGLVLDVPVKVGTSVIQSNTFNDGTTIATVANMSDLIFKGTIDETEVDRLVEGMPMKISVGALPDREFSARLEYVAPKVASSDGSANQFEIKAALTVPADVKIRAGYSANAEIILEERRGVTSVPEAAVEFDGDKAFVYVLQSAQPQSFKRREVKTGLSDGLHIEIASGLKPGEKVRGNQIQNPGAE